MKVDTNIINAIDQYVVDNGISYDRFASIMEISAASVTHWRKVGRGITKVRWQKLFPLIKQYLPQDRIYIDDAGEEQYSSNLVKSPHAIESKYIPVLVPSFSLEQLVGFDDAIDSITQYGVTINAAKVEYRPKHASAKSVFAVQIQDDLTKPVLPKNSVLYASAAEKPNNGNLVIVSTNDSIVVGFFNRAGAEFSIEPLDKSRPVLRASIKDFRQLIKWIFPVLHYEVVTF